MSHASAVRPGWGTAQCRGLESPAQVLLGWLGEHIPLHAVGVSPELIPLQSHK